MPVSDHLRYLEAESIYIIRETVATAKNPVLLFSIGKDSCVLLHLAQKALAPRPLPFPLLHIDTGFKFPEMITLRDSIAQRKNLRLLVWKNDSVEAQALGPEDAHTSRYIYIKKTKALLDALAHYGVDMAIGGSRRDEEKSRAKERIFSFRSSGSAWDPKRQRPELWHTYNTCVQSAKGESLRVFPLSNWTEADVWQYIKEEDIPVVPLYFAQKRKVVERNGIFVRVDAHVRPDPGEPIREVMCRYRTLGCSPSTGVIFSEATTLDAILEEVLSAQVSERETRAIDMGSSSAMEEKKREGYF